MKLAFLQDLPLDAGGGAQSTDRTMVLEGVRRGHDIQVIAPNINLDALNASYDLAIISNCRSFNIAEVSKSLRERKIPWVLFHHDYMQCKWRLYYPLEEKCRTCFLRERWLPVFREAILNVWLSPLHRRTALFSYPELRDRPYALVPSPVSPTEFYPMDLPRVGAVAVNAALDFKGRRLFVEWAKAHPDTPITLVGQEPDEDFDAPSNVKFVGPVPQHAMNAVYNAHETFLHLPDHRMPFDRTVAEAYLAGCHIVGNANVGALSWPFFKQGREAVVQAMLESPKRFWTAVGRAAGDVKALGVIDTRALNYRLNVGEGSAVGRAAAAVVSQEPEEHGPRQAHVRVRTFMAPKEEAPHPVSPGVVYIGGSAVVQEVIVQATVASPRGSVD